MGGLVKARQRVSSTTHIPHTRDPRVDATIVHAPSSIKNQKQERDPEMHQTRKASNGVCHEHERKLLILYRRWETASRSRLTGAGSKPPGAAAFKRRGGERPRKRHCKMSGTY
jgi:hypothetical protein